MAATNKTKRRRNVPNIEPLPQKARPKYYMTRITPDLIDRVEALRPTHIPREPFIRHVLSVGLDSMEEEGE